jgi:hypothetical protein
MTWTEDQPSTAFDDAIAAMRDEPVPDEATSHAERRRRRLLPVLARLGHAQAAELQKRQSRLRWLATAAALFAAVIAGAALSQLVEPFARGNDRTASVRAIDGSVRIVRARGVPEEATASSDIGKDDTLRTGEQGGAALDLVSGARVSVGARAAVHFERGGGGETLILSHGRVELEVPPLPKGSSLSVRTPDALVVVHGTQFSVDVAGDGDHVATTVDVIEGRVSVELDGQTAILGPGGHWTSARPAATSDDAPETRDARRAPERDVTEPSAQKTAHNLAPRAGAATGSPLADENRLFRAALAARREGDVRRARALVDELLARYPTSPLAPAAVREREELDRAIADQSKE